MSDNFNGFIKVNKDVILKLCDDLTENVSKQREHEFYEWLEIWKRHYFNKRRFFWLLPPRKYSNDGEVLDFVYKHTELTDPFEVFKVDDVSEHSRLPHEKHKIGAMKLRRTLKTACKGADEIYISLNDWEDLKSWENK